MTVEETKSILTSSFLLPLRDERSQLFVFFYHLFFSPLRICMWEREREGRKEKDYCMSRKNEEEEESIRFASSTEIEEHRCRGVPVELLTIIIIFSLAYSSFWRLVAPIDSPSSSSSSFLSFLFDVCSLLLSTKIGDTTLYMLRTEEIDIHTRARLARLRIELYSLQTCRNLFLSSLFIVSFSFVFSFFLRSYVCDGVVYAY